MTSKNLTIRQIIAQKDFKATDLFVDFSKAFDFIFRRKDRANSSSIVFPLKKKTVTAIMILDKITKAMVRSRDVDADFLSIVLEAGKNINFYLQYA